MNPSEKQPDKPESFEPFESNLELPHAPIIEVALDFVITKENAIDLGAGDLKNTKYLLEQGFDVTAVDKHPIIEEAGKNLQQEKLHVFKTSFEDFDFPKNEYDLVNAMYSLPFVSPEQFNSVFEKVKNSLKKGGVLCMQLFGANHAWAQNPSMTFHTAEQARELLKDLEIIRFKEIEKEAGGADGILKHWHFFRIITRK